MDFLKGRVNRATYWLAIGVCALLYGAIIYFTGDRVPVSEVVLLFIAIPRLHDIGKSGWWAGGSLILLYIVSFGSLLFLSSLPLETLQMILGLMTLLIFAAIITLGCIPGQPLANRFGEPPLPGVLWKQPKTSSQD